MSDIEDQRAHPEAPLEEVRPDTPEPLRPDAGPPTLPSPEVPPEPTVSDTPPVYRSGPEPLPLPSPVTDVAGRQPVGLIAFAACSLLIVVAIVGYGAFRVVGQSLKAGVTVRFNNGGSSVVERALASRAATEYPAFLVTQVGFADGAVSALDSSKVRRVFLTLQSKPHPAFTVYAVYTAPLSSSDAAGAYTNYDDFFHANAQPPGVVDSFITMWLADHPRWRCSDVASETSLFSGPLIYMATYSVVGSKDATSVWLEYHPADSSWTDTPTAAAVLDAAGNTGPFASRDDYSLIDTAAAVASVMPGFDVVGPAVGDGQEPGAVLRDRKHPGLRIVTEPSLLDPSLGPSDIVWLFGASDARRRDAFAKMWTAKHPHETISDVLVTLEPEGVPDLVTIFPFPQAQEATDVVAETQFDFTYNAKKHTWSPAKE